MRIIPALLCLAIFACSPSSSEQPEATAELSRRQKDSLIADMPLPGAGAVGKALTALEATERRALAHDSIS